MTYYVLWPYFLLTCFLSLTSLEYLTIFCCEDDEIPYPAPLVKRSSVLRVYYKDTKTGNLTHSSSQHFIKTFYPHKPNDLSIFLDTMIIGKRYFLDIHSSFHKPWCMSTHVYYAHMSTEEAREKQMESLKECFEKKNIFEKKMKGY